MLKKLTNSQRNSFFNCPRKWQFENIICRRPIETSDALTFGSAFHKFLENWWLDQPAEAPELKNAFENAKLKAMCKAYDQHWTNEKNNYLNVKTELKFQISITANIKQSAWEYAGKIDAVGSMDDGLWLVEHKTSAQDIAVGSDYWSRLEIDGQIEGYLLGFSKMSGGVMPQGVVYDVAKKPCIRPLRQDKENAESPDEYEQRCFDKIMECPSDFFVRQKIYKTAEQILSFEKTIYHSAKMIDYCVANEFFPKNANSCKGFGTCPYFDVCAGNAEITDNNRFIDSTSNPELVEG